MKFTGRSTTTPGYAAEGYEKKLTRLQFWLDVRARVGAQVFPHVKHLGLASEEAGDASVLLGLGVLPENIVLAEACESAAIIARKKFPQVRVFEEDILLTVHRFPERSFHAIYFDLCGNAGEANLLRAEVLIHRGLSKNGIFGMAVQIGREVDFDEVFKDLVKSWEAAGSKDAKFEARLEYIAEELFRRTGMRGLYGAYYVTNNEKRHVPMCTYVGTRKKGSQGEKNKFASYRDAISKAVPLAFKLQEEHGFDPALLLNVARSSLPALKAHLTRGTYG